MIRHVPAGNLLKGIYHWYIPRIAILASVFCLLAPPLHAQTLVTITDTLKNADGTNAAGRLLISWSPFTAASGETIDGGTITYTITSGVVSISLAPNIGATPSGTSYRAQYYLTNRASYRETWVLPATGPVTIAAIRVTTVPTPTVTFNALTQLTGLTAAGDLLTHDGTSFIRLAMGAADLCLQVNAGGSALEWDTCATGSGITSLNGLTAATQTFATPGTSGSAPNWSSVTSTHTLNIPMASTASVTAGLLSKTDYDAFLRSNPTATQTITAPATAGIIPLQIKGHATANANVLEVFDSQATPVRQSWFDSNGALTTKKQLTVQNSAGTDLFQIGIGGSPHMNATNSSYGIFYNGQMTNVRMGSTADAIASIPMVARGITSQTADLFQWRDSADTVLSRVDSSGRLNTTVQIISTLATGTAPFSVASVTEVANLRAATATALAADPAACPANQFGTDTNTLAALTCAALVDGDIPAAIARDSELHAQSHVIAGTAGLGADHTTSGLTAGQVLRATGATTAAFASILDGDLPASIARDSELHAQSHGEADHTGDVIPNATQVFGANFYDISEIAAPANPGAGVVRVYAKTGSGELCSRDSAGSENCMSTGSGGANHNLLSSTHSDTTAAAVSRGSLVVGKTATPVWQELVLGSSGQYLRSDATDALWATILDGDLPGTIARDSELHSQSHVLDGGDHTVSGLTAGHHLRATGAATFAFGAVLDADLPASIARDSELHTQAHVLANTSGLGADHTTSGLTAGQVLRATGATTAAFQTLPIGDTSGDLAASRVDDGAAASTQALFSGGAGAAGFRAIADDDVPDSITVTLAATATALAADPGDCTAGQFTAGINASGTAQGCTDLLSEVELDTFAELDAQIADFTLVHVSNAVTLTEKTIDAEASGNVITVLKYFLFDAAACLGASASLNWDDAGTGDTAPTAACNDTGSIQRPSADFAGGAVNSMERTIKLPTGTVVGSMDLNIRYVTTAATPTGNVEWDISTVCRAVGESWDGAFNTAQTITDVVGAQNALNDAIQAGLTSTGCAAGEDLTLKISRDGTNDTNNDLASMLHAELTLRVAM